MTIEDQKVIAHLSESNTPEENSRALEDAVLEAFQFEKCSFKNCTIEIEGVGAVPLPDMMIEWFCSCGHASQLEHEAANRKH